MQILLRFNIFIIHRKMNYLGLFWWKLNFNSRYLKILQSCIIIRLCKSISFFNISKKVNIIQFFVFINFEKKWPTCFWNVRNPISILDDHVIWNIIHQFFFLSRNYTFYFLCDKYEHQMHRLFYLHTCQMYFKLKQIDFTYF